MFRRRTPPTVSEAMASLRTATSDGINEALGHRDDSRDKMGDLEVAVAVLGDWFRRLPPESTHEPEMTFPEFIRLLHQALQAHESRREAHPPA